MNLGRGCGIMGEESSKRLGKQMTTFVHISDTHGQHDVEMPDGNVVVFSGDACRKGTFEELKAFSEWFAGLDYEHKIFVPGNHDIPFEKEKEDAKAVLPDEVIYLEDSGVEIKGMNIWGSPWQPEYGSWAFNLPRRSEEIAEKWREIPDDTDILITHGPPKGILDRLQDEVRSEVGSSTLRARVEELDLDYHLFGHIHEAGGKRKKDGTVFLNASMRGDQITYEGPPFQFEP